MRRNNKFIAKLGAFLDYVRGVGKVPADKPDEGITDFDIYFKRGNTYVKEGLYDLAIADFNIAIAINPNDVHYFYRASAWFFKKDYDKAWADVKRCRQAGGTPHPGFIEDLRKASGRQE